MHALRQIRAFDANQRNAFLAAFLGWTLDAFDFFLMVFILKDIAAEFRVPIPQVSFALTLTLAARPIGAFLFGIAGDRYGRRIPLMIDIVFFAAMELLSGFAPNLTWFLVLRFLFGIAMGGEWGLGASLVMESIPASARSVVSGVLQEGYVCGYLLAALVFPLITNVLHLGWRGMFFVGVIPALLSFFIRSHVKESPVWEAEREQAKRRAVSGEMGKSVAQIGQHLPTFLYLVLLMTAFNFMSHGTQDIYPTFLQKQHGFGPNTVRAITIIFNLGALFGGIFFGTLSEKLGRKKAIVIAALLGLPILPLWAFAPSAPLLALGGFLMQFMVQGAWGVIPAHLTELSPNSLRGTFPGFAYQLGNLCASLNGPLQTSLAERWGNNYSLALASVVSVTLVGVVLVTSLGPEAKGIAFASETARDR